MENSDELSQNATTNSNASTYYPDFSRKLVCIQYPAVVNNVDRAVATLGGLQTLEAVVGNSSRKLELRFQPKNVYCKPCVADRDYKPGVLLKVKIKRPKANVAGPSTATNVAEPIVTGYEVVGVTAMNFKFNRLCDFQYLPLVPSEGEQEEKDTPLKFIYDKILTDKLPEKQWLLSEESKTMTCFLPPTIFSRYSHSNNKLEFDKTDIYNSTMRPELGEQLKQIERRRGRALEIEDISSKVSIIHNNRRSRKAFSSTLSYDDPEVPTGPSERIKSLLRLDIVKDAPIEKIKELFDERPIWSKIAIAYKTGIPFRLLKLVLPSYAYYITSGPWRIMWVRYGYDPRKDPSARIYQTFDFRVREVDTTILRSRSAMRTTRAPKPIQKFSLKGNLKKRCANSFEIKENFFILRPGVIPAGRQIFYQFCDVLLPEVQDMLARLPEVPPGRVCDPKTGWLPDHFHEQCREIANKYVQQQAKKVFFEERDKQRSSKDVDVAESEEVAQNSDGEERIIIDDDSDEEIRQEQDDDDDDDEENIIEDGEEWNIDDEDEMPEIDMDAVEEVNKLLESSESQKQEDSDVDDETIVTFEKMLQD